MVIVGLQALQMSEKRQRRSKELLDNLFPIVLTGKIIQLSTRTYELFK